MAPREKTRIRRRPKPSLVFFLGIVLLAGCSRNEDEPAPAPGSQGYEYPSGFAFVEVPFPLAADNPRCSEPPLSLPTIGVPFMDPCFASRLTRVTTVEGVQGRHEYSRFDPFNRDKTLIVLLKHTGDYAVYRTSIFPYNQAANLVFQTNAMEDPRWDESDSDLLWGLSGFRIIHDDVRSGKRTVVKDFATDPRIAPILDSEPDIYRITMRQEGEASTDRRHWAFLLQGTREDYRPRYLFCWDRESDRVLGLCTIKKEESDIDWVGMSVNGNWVLVGGMSENVGKLRGMTIANRSLTRFQRIDYTTSHADVGIDAQGREVLIMQNSRTDFIDLIPLAWETRPILDANGSYQGTGHVPLLRLHYDSDSPIGFNSGVHISCNAPEYCLISTTIARNTPERNWLDRSNALIRLDATHPRVFLLSKVYNTTEAYFEEAHGTMSRDGSRIVWAANWNQNVGQEKMCLLQLDMPSNWKELAGDK
ncbi:MAG: hypothetical protein MUC72_04480 [Acidobacteria bacterium]|jgi:hypothetical protein|nr:hypothetical protein [Acidobacteriota bacterium]